MPSYFYHIKFELYPTSNPQSQASTIGPSPEDIWLPPPGVDIFEDLPSHPLPKRETRTLVSSPPSAAQRVYASKESSRTCPTTKIANPAVIDCGSKVLVHGKEKTLEVVTERQWLERTNSFPPPSPSAAIGPQTATRDWRFGRIGIQTIDLTSAVDMAGETSRAGSLAAPTLGPTFGGAGTATKAAYVPLKTRTTDVGWGVVHFYREGEETPGLTQLEHDGEHEDPSDPSDDCTTLCIPAVPAYMSPADFLGFIGERWRNDISHCRMVMTTRMSIYLVLLKFRDGKRAKEFRREFDGKVFNTMEPQTCHVVFVRTITFETPTRVKSFEKTVASSSNVSNSLKPFPPPTPNLVELPTCPVCLERMDETTGLMTIPCSHVFHCNCLQNWKGAGCPVCRFTNTGQEGAYDPNNPYTQPFGFSSSNLCSVCDCTDDLWICLICGYVGCGRYKGGHAKDHWKETAHSFALELETQHVWDYAGDMWVHRLIRDKGDGKLVELPGRGDGNRPHGDDDVVPRAKLETIGLEYTHLITSQLESQRAYYEEMLSKAVDKASKASSAAEAASSQTLAAIERLNLLESKYKTLSEETVPQLEKDLERERSKASKSENLARSLGKSLQEEKRLNEGLLKRIEHLGSDNENVRKQMEELKNETAELKEMNRDLTMFISGQEKLKELESEGQVAEGEIEGGSVSVPEKKTRRRGKK